MNECGWKYKNQASPSRPIVSIGDLVADLIVSIPTLPVEAGQHQLAQDIQLEPGGGANFLMAGARLGQPMAAIGVLGDDPWGHQVAALICAEGVDLSRVRHQGTSTRVVVLVSQAGEHVFLGTYGQGNKIELNELDANLIRNCGAVYCAGYTLGETRLVDLTLAAMHLARHHQRPVFFDPGPQMAEVPPELCREALASTDTLLLTEEEIPLLTSGSLAELMGLGPSTVVVKRGPNGCAVYTHQETKQPVEAPGYPVKVVDTSAAGDSFNAAYIAATLRDWPVADCTKFANAVGAAKVKKLGGGRNVPILAEVQAIIKEYNIDLKL